MRKLIIAGAGGFGAEAAWVAEEMTSLGLPDTAFEILGYVDDDPKKVGIELYGYRGLGRPEDVAGQLADRELWYYCAVGDNRIREAMAARLDALGWRPATLIHPSVVQAKYVQVGAGTYVGALSILSPNCTVGRHVIVNQRVAIGHDAVIGDFCTICPGGQINGHCHLGTGVLVGSNASIYQGRTIGDWAVLGSNSLAVGDVPASAAVIGVPAKSLRAVPVPRRAHDDL